jgi:hypothetical protein
MKNDNKMSNQLNQQSVTNYLNLGHRIWFVELEKADFRTIITKILEIPQEIYDSKKTECFWAFLKPFLQTCEIGFIRRSSPTRIELALLGYWQNKQYTIPLWMIRDLLLGFEIISTKDFTILDSEPLSWSPFVKSRDLNQGEKVEFLIQEEDLLYGNKIFLKIENSQINVSEYSSAFNFFNRIAQTDFPDQVNEETN